MVKDSEIKALVKATSEARKREELAEELAAKTELDKEEDKLLEIESETLMKMADAMGVRTSLSSADGGSVEIVESEGYFGRDD